MKKQAGFMAGICALLLIFSGNLQASNSWKLEMDKNGIKSYSRSLEGSNILEFRAVTVIDAPIETVGEVVRDMASYPLWVPYCSRGDVLHEIDRNNRTVYVYLDLPWPVADRDIVPEARTTYDLQRGRAIAEITDTRYPACPPHKDVVRLPEFRGEYVFEYITRNKTGVIYTYRADVGGSIPVSLSNMFSKMNMYKTFRNLKKMVGLPRFREMGEKSLDKEIIRGIMDDPDKLTVIMIERLREFVKHESFIQMLASSPGLYELMTENGGRISQQLLYGWGSTESKKEAVKGVLKAYLTRRNADKKAVAAAVNNEALVTAILTGSAYPEPLDQAIAGYTTGRGSSRQ